MNDRIFIELYLDEDVSVRIADLIRARGLSALTTLDMNNLGKSDADQLEFAAVQKRVFLTHNRIDFEKPASQYFDEKRDHFGIIISVRRFPNDIAARLLGILNRTTSDEMVNQIRYI